MSDTARESSEDDSLTNTLGVGGKPLIAGFYGQADEPKNITDIDAEDTDKAATNTSNFNAQVSSSFKNKNKLKLKTWTVFKVCVFQSQLNVQH